MTAQELKNSILQLAVQGKLIIDNGELKIDETGAQLLERIRAEKAKLIAEGKIKKEKDLPPITEDEKPFDIPENWCWCRLGEIFSTSSGTTPASKNPEYYKNGTINWVRTTDLNNNVLLSAEIKITEKAKIDCNLKIIPQDSVCIALYGGSGTIGKNALIKFDTTINQSVCAIHPNGLCDMIFVQLFMQWQRPNWMSYASGSRKDPNINQIIVKNSLFPLPPLSEQKAIVAKIEELLPYIEKYDAAYTKLEEFNKKFPQDMQKSILQQAVQGKIVPQNKADGNAKDLLAQIKAEKEKLIAEGKIKKEKTLAEITEDEIPFDIPENWCWCRLGEISTYANTKEKISADCITPEMWTLDLEDIEKNTGRIIQKVLAKDRKIAGDKVRFEKGDILYSKLRPYLKKNLIAPSNGICSSEIVPFKLYGQINSEYILKVLICPYVDFAINSVTYGVKMPRVGTDTMMNLPIPLPPLAEQKRIVAKIEELLPLCKKLASKN